MKMMLGALVLAGIMAGCSDSLEDITNLEAGKENADAQQDDDVKRALEAIDGISDVTVQTTDGEDRYYYFYVDQPVNHKSSDAGTFRQRCVLKYADAEAPVVLYTTGYDIQDYAGSLYSVDVATYLNANLLYMEHRYFGKSQPEELNDIRFSHLWTEECAADMHRLATLMKQNFFTAGNQWVSTGMSKGGITSALYAYWSDNNGWDDMDLYVAFGAPFLEGTSSSCMDKKTGTYLLNVCGSGYPDGTPEQKAYGNLRKFPNCIADCKPLRDACLRIFVRNYPYEYAEVLKLYPNNVEKAATAAVVHLFYENLQNKFAEVDFSSWAPLVPDPATAANPEMEPEMIEAMAEFVFANGNAMTALVEMTNLFLTKGLSPDDVRRMRKSDVSLFPYHVQAMRELGFDAKDYSALTSSNLTAGFVEEVASKVFGPEALYGGVYRNQWDGGALMKGVRAWVHTTQKHLIFVYGTNDPWTGGAIDEVTDNANVMRLMVPRGIHNDDFLKGYDKASSYALQGMISAYIRH